MIIWFIGISGSGKTTLGNKVKEYLDSKMIKSYIIDGDLVREFYNNDLGYSKEDRIANIKRIMLSAYVLEQNDILPIVCNISPFEELRDFAREKFDDYHEIYLRKNIEVAKKSDVKNVYKDNINVTSLVGVDMKFEEPKQSNLIIDVDNEEIEESFQKIIKYLESKNNEH